MGDICIIVHIIMLVTFYCLFLSCSRNNHYYFWCTRPSTHILISSSINHEYIFISIFIQIIYCHIHFIMTLSIIFAERARKKKNHVTAFIAFFSQLSQRSANSNWLHIEQISAAVLHLSVWFRYPRDARDVCLQTNCRRACANERKPNNKY